MDQSDLSVWSFVEAFHVTGWEYEFQVPAEVTLHMAVDPWELPEVVFIAGFILIMLPSAGQIGAKAHAVLPILTSATKIKIHLNSKALILLFTAFSKQHIDKDHSCRSDMLAIWHCCSKCSKSKICLLEYRERYLKNSSFFQCLINHQIIFQRGSKNCLHHGCSHWWMLTLERLYCELIGNNPENSP